MTIARASERWQPGTWSPWIFGPNEQRGAAVVCPNGHGMSVGGGPLFGSAHAISADGHVNPSLVCHRCDWHVFVQLADWSKETAHV